MQLSSIPYSNPNEIIGIIESPAPVLSIIEDAKPGQLNVLFFIYHTRLFLVYPW